MPLKPVYQEFIRLVQITADIATLLALFTSELQFGWKDWDTVIEQSGNTNYSNNITVT